MNAKKKKEIETNKVCIVGMISSSFVFNHEAFGERFYTMHVKVDRVSGSYDVIPVTVSDRLIDITQDYSGSEVKVIGQFRSHNLNDGIRNRLILSVFALDVDFDFQDYKGKSNEIFLEGNICKKPVYRVTPRGREIADLTIAVNRDYGKSDYIPCICWGRNAAYAGGLEVGTRIQVSGRVQSRDYNKKLDDGNIEVRTAYEVSIGEMEMVN